MHDYSYKPYCSESDKPNVPKSVSRSKSEKSIYRIENKDEFLDNNANVIPKRYQLHDKPVKEKQESTKYKVQKKSDEIIANYTQDVNILAKYYKVNKNKEGNDFSDDIKNLIK